MADYPTPHIAASPADFAKTVLMPGDPLRSQFIAAHFLTDAVLINNVRGVQGYTGYYKNTRVSVMASGMGMPSMGIYAYELYHIFGVENILRIGSAGAMQTSVHVRDIVLGMSCSTTSDFARQYGLPGTYAPTASYKLLRTAADLAESLGLSYHVGNLLTSDTFYDEREDGMEAGRPTVAWSKMGVLATEMEAAALYMTAARAGKNALAICTISDHMRTGESTTSEERQNSFTDMMTLALETAIRL